MSLDAGRSALRAQDPDTATERLLRWLRTREHSREELERKLLAEGFAAEVVTHCLDRLAERGLQSDERFVEDFVESRLRNGWGPQQIRHQLAQRGVTGEAVARWLDLGAGQWHALMIAAHDKKFGRAPPLDPNERGRRARFLAYRGFEVAEVRRFLWSNHAIES